MKKTLAESIRETMDALSESGKPVEITTASREEISKAWPGVVYKGHAFFDEYVKQAGYIPDKNNMQAQECYLGYSKDEDLFYIGFDVWPEHSDDGGYAVYEMRFHDDGVFEVLDKVDSDEGSMFYNSRRNGRSGYDEVKRNVPDIVDLRLD